MIEALLLALPVRTFQTARLACYFGGEHLNRDVTSKARVARPIDFAHPARANGVDDLIRAEAGADGEGRWR